MLIKKGAMFGLDARIALAIFGALSVISGAALYSAIQDAKVTSSITELEEVGKAFDAYFFDRGEMMKKDGTSKFALNIGELVSNTESSLNWNGPYISLEKGSLSTLLSIVNNPKTVSLQYRPNSSWGGADGDTLPPAECAAAPCFIWVTIGLAEKTLAHAIDEKVDGTGDNKTGRIRIWDYTSGVNDGKSNVYYQYSVAPVQP
ncbi:MAG TPA: hypothetical protein DCL21_05380 [Alphaproteobacteria bacterium]|nr:hypothetical protein [Alphaproteobacteria bacterium]